MERRYELQYAVWPYGPAENIPDDAWMARSRHASIEVAIRTYIACCVRLEQSQGDGCYRIVDRVTGKLLDLRNFQLYGEKAWT